MAWQEEKNEPAVLVQLFEICIFQVSILSTVFFFFPNKDPTKYVCTQEVLLSSEVDEGRNKVIDLKHSIYRTDYYLCASLHPKKRRKLSLKFSYVVI